MSFDSIIRDRLPVYRSFPIRYFTEILLVTPISKMPCQSETQVSDSSFHVGLDKESQIFHQARWCLRQSHTVSEPPDTSLLPLPATRSRPVRQSPK